MAPAMFYLPFLRRLHELLEPRNYLEIGVRDGGSMSQARCRTVGIDPAFVIDKQINCPVTLFRTTSDEYFTRPDPLAPTGGQPFDLTFIDGMHLFEFALRDFINTERHCSAKSVIVFDDILPRNVDEAARQRHTLAWTGDVYPLVAVLRRYRADLTVVPVGTFPTGLLIVMGVDPQSTVLADNYDEIIAEYRKPDPQPVPEVLMDRSGVVHPSRALAATIWTRLGAAGADESVDSIRSWLRPSVAAELGVAFTPELNGANQS